MGGQTGLHQTEGSRVGGGLADVVGFGQTGTNRFDLLFGKTIPMSLNKGESLGSSEKEPILLDRALLKAGKSVTLIRWQIEPCLRRRSDAVLAIGERRRET